MTFDEFQDLIANARKENPFWFSGEQDPPATDAQIAEAEARLGVTFPKEYRLFLEKYGGGEFGLMNVFSVDFDSEWNVVARNLKEGHLAHGNLAISDPHTGDMYGFRCVRGHCDAEIWAYDHDSEEWQKTSFATVFDFVAKAALNEAP